MQIHIYKATHTHTHIFLHKILCKKKKFVDKLHFSSNTLNLISTMLNTVLLYNIANDRINWKDNHGNKQLSEEEKRTSCENICSSEIYSRELSHIDTCLVYALGVRILHWISVLYRRLMWLTLKLNRSTEAKKKNNLYEKKVTMLNKMNEKNEDWNWCKWKNQYRRQANEKCLVGIYSNK